MSDVYVGIDLGGTTITCAAADGQGRILAREHVDTDAHEGPEAVIRRMGDLVLKVAEGGAAGVGVGVPGLIDLERGMTRFLPNLPTKWRDVPVAEPLQAMTGSPVRLLNDCRCAALGEMTFGHGRGVPELTFAYFTLGTGVGGAVAIDGKLRLGPVGAAGELGHLAIIPDGPPCGCGGRGCLETVVSGPAIVGEAIRLMRSGQAATLHKLAEGRADNVTPKVVAQAAREGDAAAAELIERVARYLGIAVANVVTVLHPQLVVFAGGVAQMGELLLEPIRQTVVRRAGMVPTDDVEIRLSELGADAGVMGGVALAMQTGAGAPLS